jgi:hypothetical protein
MPKKVFYIIFLKIRSGKTAKHEMCNDGAILNQNLLKIYTVLFSKCWKLVLNVICTFIAFENTMYKKMKNNVKPCSYR